MPQSPQHRPLVQSTRTKYTQSTSLEHSPEYVIGTRARVLHWNTRQSTSLELSHEVFHKIHNVNSQDEKKGRWERRKEKMKDNNEVTILGRAVK
jgi:hypothetical protein